MKHDGSPLRAPRASLPPLLAEQQRKDALDEQGLVPAANLGLEGVDAVEVPALEAHGLAVALNRLAEEAVGPADKGDVKGPLASELEERVKQNPVLARPDGSR